MEQAARTSEEREEYGEEYGDEDGDRGLEGEEGEEGMGVGGGREEGRRGGGRGEGGEGRGHSSGCRSEEGAGGGPVASVQLALDCSWARGGSVHASGCCHAALGSWRLVTLTIGARGGRRLLRRHLSELHLSLMAPPRVAKGEYAAASRFLTVASPSVLLLPALAAKASRLRAGRWLIAIANVTSSYLELCRMPSSSLILSELFIELEVTNLQQRKPSVTAVRTSH